MAYQLLNTGADWSIPDHKGNNAFHFLLKDKYNLFFRIMGERSVDSVFETRNPWNSPFEQFEILYPKWFDPNFKPVRRSKETGTNTEIPIQVADTFIKYINLIFDQMIENENGLLMMKNNRNEIPMQYLFKIGGFHTSRWLHNTQNENTFYQPLDFEKRVIAPMKACKDFDPNLRDRCGVSPLYSYLWASLDYVDFVITYGQDLKIFQEQGSYCIVKGPEEDTLEDLFPVALLLLQAGANPFMETKDSQSVFTLAAFGGSRLVEFISKYNLHSVPSPKLNQEGFLHSELKKFGRDPTLPTFFIDLLLQSADPNEKNREGETVQHIAARLKLFDVLEKLVSKQGSLFDVPDNDGFTCRMHLHGCQQRKVLNKQDKTELNVPIPLDSEYAKFIDHKNQFANDLYDTHQRTTSYKQIRGFGFRNTDNELFIPSSWRSSTLN